jgi:hypothetical protein
MQAHRMQQEAPGFVRVSSCGDRCYSQQDWATARVESALDGAEVYGWDTSREYAAAMADCQVSGACMEPTTEGWFPCKGIRFVW